jgi:hypothetical protein
MTLLAALAIAAPVASAAQQPGPESAAAAPHPHASAIAEIMLPLDKTVEAAIATGKRAFFEMFRSNPEIAEMEQSFPGIAAALWPEIEPELRRATIEGHPAYMNMVASFYSARFTPAELEALRTLYSTPTGAKMMGSIHGDTGPNAIVDEVIRNPDAPVSHGAAEEMIRAKTERMVALLTEEDEAPLLAALRVVPEAKMIRANADLVKLLVEWMNKPTPELDARLQAIMEKTVERFLAEQPPKD